MNYFFWLLLNIGVPVLGPIFLLALVSIPYGRAVSKGMIFDSVKDGQLFWAAIALSAAALYELFTCLDKLKAEVEVAHEATRIAAMHIPTAVSAASQALSLEPSPWLILMLQISIVPFCVIALSSAFLVMMAGMKTYHDNRERAAVASALAAAGAMNAGGAAAAHGVPAPSANTAQAAGDVPQPPNPEWNNSLKASLWLTGAAALFFAILHPFAS
jgi:hypothetical protein